jgi:hypothetical protein
MMPGWRRLQRVPRSAKVFHENRGLSADSRRLTEMRWRRRTVLGRSWKCAACEGPLSRDDGNALQTTETRCERRNAVSGDKPVRGEKKHTKRKRDRRVPRKDERTIVRRGCFGDNGKPAAERLHAALDDPRPSSSMVCRSGRAVRPAAAPGRGMTPSRHHWRQVSDALRDAPSPASPAAGGRGRARPRQSGGGRSGDPGWGPRPGWTSWWRTRPGSAEPGRSPPASPPPSK